jgi:hypothetical protein
MREESSFRAFSAGINLQSVPDVSRLATFFVPLHGKRISKQFLRKVSWATWATL